jgi:hypothetical protein
MLKKLFKEKSIVFSDKSIFCTNKADDVSIYMTEKSREKKTRETLKWLHIAIGIAKIGLQKFLKIKLKYLQLYLSISLFTNSKEVF